jgi:hypothetical protein
MLEQLDEGLFELRSDVTAVNLAVRENENAIGRTIYFSDTPPSIYDDVDSGDTLADGTPIFLPNELNYKFWYDTDRLELLVLYKDPGDGAYSYVPVSLPLTNIDLDSLNSQVQANSYSNNQQSQAIQALETLIFDRVAKTGDTMIGDLKFEGTNKVVTRNIDSGQNSNLELKHNGITRLYVGGSAVSINSQGVLQQEGTEDNHLVTKKYVDDLTDDTNNSISTFETAIKAAGFQLGNFRYRRGSDSFVSGSIQSNTSTNPANIVELKIWHTNQDGVQFGKEFYEKFITEKMYVHIRDKGECSYVGRIDGIEMVTNGIKLTLTPLTNVIDGSVYYNNTYDVSIGYNKFGIKYPQ